MNLDKLKKNLYREIEEAPGRAIAVGAGVLTAVSQLIKANNERANSKTWRNEVRRREHATYSPIRRKK